LLESAEMPTHGAATVLNVGGAFPAVADNGRVFANISNQYGIWEFGAFWHSAYSGGQTPTDANNDGVVVNFHDNFPLYWHPIYGPSSPMTHVTESNKLYAVNNHGVAVGAGRHTQSGKFVPILYGPTIGTFLLPLPGGATEGEARGINDHNTVVGWVKIGDSHYAYRWDTPGTGTYFDYGSYQSKAMAINNAGLVVGCDVPTQGTPEAIFWETEGTSPPQAIGVQGCATDVSERGRMVGLVHSWWGTTGHAFTRYGSDVYTLSMAGLREVWFGPSVDTCGRIYATAENVGRRDVVAAWYPQWCDA